MHKLIIIAHFLSSNIRLNATVLSGLSISLKSIEYGLISEADGECLMAIRLRTKIGSKYRKSTVEARLARYNLLVPVGERFLDE